MRPASKCNLKVCGNPLEVNFDGCVRTKGSILMTLWLFKYLGLSCFGKGRDNCFSELTSKIYELPDGSSMMGWEIFVWGF